jgi:hypothetical protein
MKNLKLWSLALASVLALSSCSEEEEDNNDNNNNNTQMVGIQGEWQSSGANVAPLLSSLFGTDSIYADFRIDMTYTVEQYDSTGASLTLTGTYSQEESGVDDIWNITVNQSAPAALTSEGMFEVDGNTMTYEVVQTSPDIGATPPNPADGFGSSGSGGQPLGALNIQTYQRIE